MTRTFELAFSQESFSAAVAAIAASRKTRPGGRKANDAYLDQYRADAFTEDFIQLSVEDAAMLALDLWDLDAANQASDKRVIRVHRPVSVTGHPLPISVAEIVGPDIAFLVDSAILACQDARLDVRAVLHPVLRHRLILSYDANAENVGADAVIDRLIEKVAVPA